ncbi:acetate uptake transporter [Magnetospirillum molischianum]|uniref:Inner membrane protein yaaH n=1 Tax=Magnetospirillum molischianum DSM 120 TaxID=1150626 RepID=H8FSW5_MAGML|nr:GPR1/FUN34/YaaH family transporter [Magnetospirillum molischianum]CCG41453.1 Inner membrane protein yaaH [Magnetospirillum molischianum DSM 120]
MSHISAVSTDQKTGGATAPKLGNPAVIGLAGFGLTTMMLQFHNIGWAGIGPVIWLGLVFGGLAQVIAGLQEQKTGNNFGYVAFTSYGCFWISLAAMLIANKFDLFPSSTADIGWFLVGWTLFTTILWVGSLRISKAMAGCFTTLLIGFILLDLAHFGYPQMTVVAGWDLLVCAGLAWYMMASIVLGDLFGRTVLPVGKPVL